MPVAMIGTIAGAVGSLASAGAQVYSATQGDRARDMGPINPFAGADTLSTTLIMVDKQIQDAQTKLATLTATRAKTAATKAGATRDAKLASQDRQMEQWRNTLSDLQSLRSTYNATIKAGAQTDAERVFAQVTRNPTPAGVQALIPSAKKSNTTLYILGGAALLALLAFGKKTP